MLRRAYHALRRTYFVMFKPLALFLAREARIKVDRGDQKIICKLNEFDDFAFLHGDVFTIQPAIWPRVMTPDGSFHLLAGPSLPIRIPPRMEFCQFQDYQLPVHLVNLT